MISVEAQHPRFVFNIAWTKTAEYIQEPVSYVLARTCQTNASAPLAETSSTCTAPKAKAANASF